MSTTPLPPTKPHKVYTLILPVDPSTRTVVLGVKKRGFGIGKLNGYGGKLEPSDPSIYASALRELWEESGLTPVPTSAGTAPPATTLIPIGILFLESLAPLSTPPTPKLVESNTLPILEIHIYIAPLASYVPATGPVETEEMKPVRCSIHGAERGGVGETDGLAEEVDATQPTPPPPGIPTSRMWTEAILWMPPTLRYLFPPPGNNEVINPNTTIMKPFFFAHYTFYSGSISPNTGQWDPWEGLLHPSITSTSPKSNTLPASDPSVPSLPKNDPNFHILHDSRSGISNTAESTTVAKWGLNGEISTLGGCGDSNGYVLHSVNVNLQAQEAARMGVAMEWLEERRREEWKVLFGGGEGGDGGC